MDTPQLPGLPDAVKNATPQDAQKYPWGLSFLTLISAVLGLFSIVLWISNGRLKDQVKGNEQCQVEKKEERAAREKAEKNYADLAIQVAISQGTIKVITRQADSVSSQ